MSPHDLGHQEIPPEFPAFQETLIQYECIINDAIPIKQSPKVPDVLQTDPYHLLNITNILKIILKHSSLFWLKTVSTKHLVEITTLFLNENCLTNTSSRLKKNSWFVLPGMGIKLWLLYFSSHLNNDTTT